MQKQKNTKAKITIKIPVVPVVKIAPETIAKKISSLAHFVVSSFHQKVSFFKPGCPKKLV